MQLYEVAFFGDLAPNALQEDVKRNLAALFKADERKIAAMFSGQKITIKSKVDAKTAEKYRLAMLKAGAVADVISLDDDLPAASNNAGSPSSPNYAKEAAAAQTAKLRTPPENLAHPHNVGADTSNLAPLNIAPKDGYMAAFTHVKAPNFGVDKVGVRLQKPVVHQAPKLDLSGFSLAQTGAKLEQKTKNESIKVPDISHLKILD